MKIGVPYISPVSKSKLRPWGRFGYISQLSGMPPDQVGVKSGIISLTVKSILYGSYRMFIGEISSTESIKLIVIEPPVFEAVT